MIARIYIGGKRVDLFEDETITVNSSIGDVSDIQKTTTDYSKDFTVPASANNNKLFKHYYNADIDNSFDARTKVLGRIELSGVPFKFGKFRLLKVAVKSGKPESYTINFVGNLVDIKKELGKDELSSLDLSAYDHDFDGDTVKEGLTNSLFGGDLIYTLNPKRQYFYSSDVNENTDIDELTNIADNGSAELHGIRFSDLAPALKPIRILEAVESKYDLNFSRDFFGTSVFTDLYQTLVNNKDSIAGGTVQIDFDGGSTENVSLVSNVGSFYAQASSASNDNIEWFNKLTITPSSGYENVTYTLSTIIDGAESGSETTTGTEVFDNNLGVNGQQTFEVSYNITSSEEFKFTAIWRQLRRSTVTSDPPFSSFTTTASEQTLQSEFVTSKNISKIKVIDWLVGLFKAFKLVIIPQQDGTFYVDTLNRYYSLGRIKDLTKYIDFESYDVERGELFNEISFSFEDPDTILNQQFEKNNGIAYGNEEVKLEDEDGEPLDGDTYSIELPFETVVYDRLTNTVNDQQTSIMYAPFVDEDRKPSFPKCNLFYIERVGHSAYPLRFINNNNTIERLSSVINTAIHSQELNTNNSNAFIFGSEFSEWNGQLLSKNLYTNYHQKYIDGIFNVKRRNFKFKAVLPINVSTQLELSDVIKIKGSYYRMDNYDTNINTGETTFKLINSFANDLNDLYSINNTMQFSSQGGINVSSVNEGNSFVTVSDIGYGVGWVNPTLNDTQLTIQVDPNNTGENRSAFVIVSDRAKVKPDAEILVRQEADIITFGSTGVLWGSEIITFND